MRKVCIVTGSRAEYGLLRWLMQEVASDATLILQTVVTGMHLSPEFGLTYREIERDGFVIDAKVEMLLSSDTPVGITKSLGLGTIGFADTFERLAPDIVVLLGDRYEILAAAQAAMIARIPIAHLHGGEATEGLIDEAIRHSVTKMAHFHFVAADAYRQRVIQLGESPDRVFNFGAIGLDNLQRIPLLNQSALEKSLDFDLSGGPIVLATYHPVTLDSTSAEKAMLQLLEAIEAIPDARIVFTKTNADTGGRVINQILDEYVAQHQHKARAYVSLGQLRYLSLMSLAHVVLGNSSSGLLEAPSAGTPTVNIGPRQDGRLRAPSVIDSNEDTNSIICSLQQALSWGFQQTAKLRQSPYGNGGVSIKIRDTLRQANLDGVVIKRFHNLPTPT